MADLFIFGYGSSAPSKIDISSATVTLGSALTYTGNELIQSITSVVVGGTTLTEGTDYNVTDNTGTNAGNYTLTIMGIGKYTGTKTVSWSIAKAAGSISVNPASLSIMGTNNTATSTITKVGDGAVSVGTSASGVATASVSGNTVTVTSAGSGSATITVTLGTGTNYTGGSSMISVSVIVADSTLANNTPATIQAVAQSGMASSVWSVGDRTAAISIGAFSDIAATTNVSAFIIGFNHNSSKEGNGIHFQFGKIGNTDVAFYSLVMRNDGYNTGGWNGSDMKKTHCPAFLAALPSTWQNVISACTKYTDNTGGGSNTASYVTATTDDKIWLLAEYEVFGARSYANSAEQNYQLQYDYYKNGNSKVKYRHNSTSSARGWWLRSPGSGSSDGFCGVSSYGGATSERASSSNGFAPGFKVA